MREIKFRAFSKELGMSEPATMWELVQYQTDFDEFETYTEYTGLKDKNGNEIYEGDIVRVFQPFNVPQKAIVEFSDGCFDLKGIELTWRDYVKCFVVNHAIEVIGNIHENPELLER